MPSLLEYMELEGKLPQILTFSLASLLAFYRGTDLVEDALVGSRKGRPYKIQDDRNILEFFYELWSDYENNMDLGLLCTRALEREDFWDMDLTKIPGLCQRVKEHLKEILDRGMESAVGNLCL